MQPAAICQLSRMIIKLKKGGLAHYNRITLLRIKQGDKNKSQVASERAQVK